ncbi:U6 snRNA phosphodiesterase [Polistes fuscatus]|uniref:U6 snRNA phosphodiesterase n=1 Tax=Polistes fuscatus TaxID=30207 RepID=UPI001CA8F208|nr:U6 snRNA phosphodiesterase [Polistes fuscatus]
MSNSLSAINDNYLSDSSDEDEEEEEEEKKLRKTGETLFVPESILSWKGVPHHEEKIDNPSEHNGRIRSFKHERGNWSTLIYINYTATDTMLSWIKSIETLLPKDSNILLDQFHLSLTRTLVLKYHWIESFVKSLKELCSVLVRFYIELMDIKVYCNEERTRTFLAINCSNTMLNFTINIINNMLAEYQLPPYYEDPSNHISIFWWVGDKENCLNKVLPSIKSSFEQFYVNNTEDNYVYVDELHCKIGNKLYTFPLKLHNHR